MFLNRMTIRGVVHSGLSDVEAADLEEYHDWFKTIWNVAKIAAGFSPIGKYVKAVGTIYSIVEVAVELMHYIERGIATDGTELTPAQQSYARWQLALAMSQIGGSVATIDTPNGVQIIVLEDTPYSLTNNAGLGQSNDRCTPEHILTVLQDHNHPDYDGISDFLNRPSDERQSNTSGGSDNERYKEEILFTTSVCECINWSQCWWIYILSTASTISGGINSGIR